MNDDEMRRIRPSQRPAGWQLGLSGSVSQEPKDELTCGIGKFGFDVTNPIPTKSVADGYAYLNFLLFSDGSPAKYKRIGSRSADNISRPIDAYQIYNVDGAEICVLFISAYQAKSSRKSPEGFR
jgi:hypothetical protein